MKIQKFRGYLKYSVDVIEDLQLYEENGKHWFIKDLFWIEEREFSADVYDLSDFDKIEEYFEEI